MRCLISAVLLVCSVLLGGEAFAGGSVYLNNVRIDGVTNQKFDKVNVRIDEQGNVFIDAPGYNVKQVEGGPGAAAPKPQGTLTKRYFLVSEHRPTGMAEFDIDVYVNSKWVKKLRNGDDQIVADVTKHLTPGSNAVLFMAKKQLQGTRKSFSKEHVFRVVLGEGQTVGDQVTIESSAIKFECTAADGNDVTQEFTLVTR
ncbi:MAG: hypothetical protein JNK82_15950 [Myxococcaceae bacterium]|nr:hypothetical protein [Myxococcaceae bacterium]